MTSVPTVKLPAMLTEVACRLPPSTRAVVPLELGTVLPDQLAPVPQSPDAGPIQVMTCALAADASPSTDTAENAAAGTRAARTPHRARLGCAVSRHFGRRSNEQRLIRLKQRINSPPEFPYEPRPTNVVDGSVDCREVVRLRQRCFWFAPSSTRRLVRHIPPPILTPPIVSRPNASRPAPSRSSSSHALHSPFRHPDIQLRWGVTRDPLPTPTTLPSHGGMQQRRVST